VNAAREWQYTTAGGEIELPWDGIHEWRKVEQGDTVDTLVAKANEGLLELYCSVAAKQELSNTAKLSVLKSFFITIRSYGHHFWVMTN